MHNGQMFGLPRIGGPRLTLEDMVINHDAAHGPWPEHLDAIQKLASGGVEKIRVDMNGNILSSHVYLGPIKL